MAAPHLRPPPPTPAPQPAAGADFPAPLAFSTKPDHLVGIKIGGTPAKLAMIRRLPLIMFGSVGRRSTLRVEGTREPSALTRELTEGDLQRLEEPSHDDPFQDLKSRFLRFKKQNCVENPIQFHNLAQAQEPKFMVIACADSRVCPSNVLGFQPGEAFTVRNVANLVPPFEHGASETSAALEFAVNSLEVGNILVVGHSCCGGIQALMSMHEGANSSFIKEWVSIGKSARLSTKAAAGNQSFEMQCKHCEKESINGSLLNLLSYPWIERRVIEGKLSIHGGYYDFVNCTFEKWTLVYRENMEGGSQFGIKDRAFWS